MKHMQMPSDTVEVVRERGRDRALKEGHARSARYEDGKSGDVYNHQGDRARPFFFLPGNINLDTKNMEK